jgi:hypothetical protein
MKDSQLHARTPQNLDKQSLLSNCITDKSHYSVDKLEERNPCAGSLNPFVHPTAYSLH